MVISINLKKDIERKIKGDNHEIEIRRLLSLSSAISPIDGYTFFLSISDLGCAWSEL